MTDDRYKEEQQNEIDILQSIYPTEFEEIATDPYKYSIKITIEDEDEIRPCVVSLVVEYTPTYPDELPEFALVLEEEDEDGEDFKPLAETDATLSEVDIEDMKAKAREMAEESIGMAMVFGMATTLKEICADRLREKTEELKRIREQRIKKEIEAEQAKFVGTLVTRANFLEWKKKFEREMDELKQRQADQTAISDSRGASRRALAGGAPGSKKEVKLSGRELFEHDRALAQSDSKFIADGDVSVDASLFSKEEDISDDDDDDN
ncbi:rwd domain-containing protein [Coemansia sp. RSA 1813]|nr:Protein gir2 [Coemansia sp. RSA 1646]KAJ1768152.1 rwd domain-containing protein [Coemansia sp. RSA 1843]KAJ2217179.1 rwd domain-containing protein [Coemansia sp. RSA 487]KAJ2572377.1 rwd domain-containing protein [Coemansia sp. RSA 1813]